MELRVSASIRSGIVLLSSAGRLRRWDLSLKQTVDGLLGCGYRKFALDSSQLRYIDCFGLSQLIAILVAIHGSGGDFILIRPRHFVLQVLQITRLDTVFRIEHEKAAKAESLSA